MQTKKCSVHFPINLTSYGIVARNLLIELDKQNIEVSLFPIGQIECEIAAEIEIVKKCINNAKTFSSEVPHIRLFHQFSLAERVGRGLLFGFPIFELENFSPLERHHIEQCDRIICASEWAKNIVLNRTNQKNIHVCPLGANPIIFKRIPIQRQDDTFKILCLGKIEIRKLHDKIPEIFSKAFAKEDNVELIMSWHNPFCNLDEHKSWEKFYQNSPLGEKIKFQPRLKSSLELNELYNSVDTMLSISRAEGAHLPSIEMLQIGKPIIFVNYSGITEYLNKDNAYPIEIDSLEDAYDAKFFIPGGETNQGKWAHFGDSQIDQCVNILRKLYKEKQEGKQYSPILTTHFTWENSVKKLIKVLYE